MPRRYRRRHGKRGRFPKPINIEKAPVMSQFIPMPGGDTNPIHIESAELEAIRLIDLEDLSQEEAGERMGVSRGTVWRIIQSARKKTAQALSEGRTLNIIQPNSKNNNQQKTNQH